jgi:hypothetical protein
VRHCSGKSRNPAAIAESRGRRRHDNCQILKALARSGNNQKTDEERFRRLPASQPVHLKSAEILNASAHLIFELMGERTCVASCDILERASAYYAALLEMSLKPVIRETVRRPRL